MSSNNQKRQSPVEKKTKQLTATTLSINELTAEHKNRMYAILCSNYNKTSYQQFLVDLSKKDYVVLVFDLNETIQGFSTQAIFSQMVGTENCNILFSGDTIINPEYWGTQELVKEFVRLVGRLINADSNQKWYWFLISKGHRTYLYLPLFFKQYYPGLPEKNNEQLKPLLDSVSRKMFGEHWNPDTGLIVFPSSMGELIPELAEGSFKRKNNKHTEFFLEKNPEFYKGHELACLAPLNMENLHTRLHRYLNPNFA